MLPSAVMCSDHENVYKAAGSPHATNPSIRREGIQTNIRVWSGACFVTDTATGILATTARSEIWSPP
jgi:hypothetical protein